MRKYRFTLLSISIFFFTSTLQAKSALKAPSEELPQIKILIKQDSSGALLESKGEFTVTNPENNKKLSAGKSGKRFFLHGRDDGIKWGEGYPGVYQIALYGTKPTDTFLLDGIEYDGKLNFYDIDNKISVTNEISIESYLKYLLTEKYDGEHMDMKALKCLAIIHRTTLYDTVSKNKKSYWQVDATKNPFLGSSQAKRDALIDEAVDSTQSVILTYNYRPFIAEVTNHSSGITAHYPQIFRKNVLAPNGVESPIARKEKEKSAWSYKIDKSEFAKLIKISEVAAIDTYEDKQSSRVYGLKIKDKNSDLQLDFFKFQNILGHQNIKSNLFTIKIEKDNINFSGFGNGHGVGLCLFSALEMAKKGSTVEQILLDFFPNTLLQEIRKIDFSKDGFEDF